MDRRLMVYLLMAVLLIAISISYIKYGVLGVFWVIAAIVIGYNIDTFWKWWKGKRDSQDK